MQVSKPELPPLQDFPGLKQAGAVTGTIILTFPVCLMKISLNEDHKFD